MSTTATYPTVPTDLEVPAPVGRADVFDFLWTPEPSLASEDQVTVSEPNSAGLVEVTIQRTDGRSLSRIVPAESWENEEYREAFLRSVCMLLA